MSTRKGLLFAWVLGLLLLLVPAVAFAADGDGDGVEDGVDNCPEVSNPDQLDADEDDVGDACDTCPGLFNTEQDDADEDGVGDGCDGCPNDADKVEEGLCGCGVSDDDGDNDGTPDCDDECPDDPNKITGGLCGCGEDDTNDSDNDGVADCNDGCPDNPDKGDPGICGCDILDTDSDGDNTPDCFDLCPADPNKTAPGACGCGNSDQDDDNDGLPACDDNCPDDPNTGQLDGDEDGVGDVCDNCLLSANGDQADSDGDGAGDACDACPEDADKIVPGSCGCGTPDNDPDGDSQGACDDNCPEVNNPDQDDTDGDGAGNACDVCPGLFNPDQADSDGDGLGDACEACPDDPDKAAPGQCGCGVAETDGDNDGVADCIDNCEGTSNSDQANSDGDDFGDACDACPGDGDKNEPGQCGCGNADTDSDNDGAADCNDNCVNDANSNQADNDGDGVGDACDACPADPNKAEEGACGCGVADTDGDNDNVADCNDNCPEDSNSIQEDSDEDGTGDACDGCASDPNKTEAGVCGCGVSDADDDTDGVADCDDNCPAEANPDQADTDGDGDGDVCDDFLCPAEGDEIGNEVCDGVDNDCNGDIDDDAPCPPGLECQSGECQPGRPDFLVTTADIFIEDRDIDVSEPFILTADIHNVGAVDGVNVAVNLLDMGFVVRSTTIDFLPAGGTATVEFELSFDEASLRIAQVRIDPDNFFDEIDEENNNATKIVRVGQPPPGFNGRLVVEAGHITTCGGNNDLHIGGRAYYEFTDEGTTFTFPVQGGLVTIAFDGRVYTAHTNTHGRFLRRYIHSPFTPGVYPAHIDVSDSDIEGSTSILVNVTDELCNNSPPTHTPRREDVWVHSHDITLSPSHRPTLGETIDISSTIHHYGFEPRPDIPVSVFAHHPENGQLVRETLGIGKVDFLSGNPDKQDFTVSWTNDDEGVYIIQTVIAPGFRQYTGNDRATRLIVVGEYKRYAADITMSPNPFDNLCDGTISALIQLPEEVDIESVDFTGGGVFLAEPPELQDNDGDGTQLIRAIADTAVFGDHNDDGIADVMVDFDGAAFAAATPDTGPKLVEVVGFLDTRDAFSGFATVELVTDDDDEDGVGDACDNCPEDFNPGQAEVCDDSDNGNEDDDNNNEGDNGTPDEDEDEGEGEGGDDPQTDCSTVQIHRGTSGGFGLVFGGLLMLFVVARRRL